MVIKHDQSLELTMPNMQTISASEFKARCLELLDRLADRTLDRVTITKRGRVVGVLLPPESHADAVRRVHGFMRGSVAIPPGIDLTEPASVDFFTAEDGIFHG
jgi:prevent-host-death family protein